MDELISVICQTCVLAASDKRRAVPARPRSSVSEASIYCKQYSRTKDVHWRSLEERGMGNPQPPKVFTDVDLVFGFFQSSPNSPYGQPG